MRDCRESKETEQFDDDLQTATEAIHATEVAYSDMLEELALSDKGVELMNEVRKVYGSDPIEYLRQQLKETVGEHKEGEDVDDEEDWTKQ